jgi:hypothetical protein
MRISQQKERRRGSAIIEFALVGSFIFLPILAGLATVGMSLVGAMQVASLNSNAGQMFSGGVDFTHPPNPNIDILLAIAGTLNNSSGSGKVILSEIDATTAADGTSIVLTCTNQVTVPFGASGGQGTSGYAPGGVLNYPAFNGLLPGMVSGQVAYLAETFYTNSNYTWAGTNNGLYSMAIF